MCGIVGYIGRGNAVSAIARGMRNVLYRGYHAAGMVVVTDDGDLRLRKRIYDPDKGIEFAEEDFLDILEEGEEAHIGIGHTRWPTHGRNLGENAHPHSDEGNRIFVVHNGTINNDDDIRARLLAQGISITSRTDTELIAHLVAIKVREGVEFVSAVKQTIQEIDGEYALLIMDVQDTSKMVAVALGSSMLVGYRDSEVIVASDEVSLAEYATHYQVLKDGELLVISSDGSFDRQKELIKVSVNPEDAQLGDFPHFMYKEIMEQPRVVERAFAKGGRIDFKTPQVRFGGLRKHHERLARVEHIVIVGCGTAWHAGLIGMHYLKKIAGIPHVECMVASEADLSHLNASNSAVIFISQSGETTDTLRVLREAQVRGIFTIGVVNRPGTVIPRETHCGVFCKAGLEVGVASTKVFTSQVTVMFLIALYLGRQRRVSKDQIRCHLETLQKIPAQLNFEKVSDSCDKISRMHLVGSDFVGFVGKGVCSALALEGALKFREVTYIPSLGLPIGELKHGTIALCEPDRPVIAIVKDDEHFEDVMVGLKQIASAGSRVIAVADISVCRRLSVGLPNAPIIPIEGVYGALTPIALAVPLQLLAYYTSIAQGFNPDKPRNLAKSVTVK